MSDQRSPLYLTARRQVWAGAAACTALAAAWATGSAFAAQDDGATFSSEHYDYRVVTVVDGLEHPWAVAFLPDGGMLVTERPGRLRLVRDGELASEPVAGVPEVWFGGQGGLLDVVLHPDFESNSLVYLTYSKPNDDATQGTTAVIRGRLDGQELADVEEIFEADAWDTRRGHFGSRIAFDPDGYMFVTIGDRQFPPAGDLEAHPAQDPSNHIGTIVRLHDDGSVPEDNPFVDEDGVRPEIWSYGHRNPQGLAVHPETGQLWSHEHGPQGGDELHAVEPGSNYGWPVIGYGVQYGPARQEIHEGTERAGMEQPVHYWDPSIAPSGFAIYDGDRFPEWQGDLFVGALGGLTDCCRQLSRITVDGNEFVGEEKLLEDQYRIRDVRSGPDGYIYVVLNDRAGAPTPIVRLEPVE